MDTLELKIELDPKDPWSDILIAELSENGFDSFVAIENGIMAYAPADLDYELALNQSAVFSEENVEIKVTKSVLAQKNWNEEWESNFLPVQIEDYATIVAPFHDCIDAKGLVVVIQPQMSFGTGHHQTTWMMTKSLFEMEFMPNEVLDMGSGTGVLAIVAEKLGASHILAIDIEEWSVENAIENAERNNCTKISCVCGDVDKIRGKQFGLILANINKNILKLHMESYANSLVLGGDLFLSGFFTTDVDEITECANQFNLQKISTKEKEGWACVHLQKLK